MFKYRTKKVDQTHVNLKDRYDNPKPVTLQVVSGIVTSSFTSSIYISIYLVIF
ncbi:hypothetical protein HanRHA438_Chr05g0224131 [Helianthus annuus]|nr:hypothetical protein HanRHA438_Chr05g0224131 [Helianthus annuus]